MIMKVPAGIALVILIVCAALASGCTQQAPAAVTPEPTGTPAPEVTPEATPTPEPSPFPGALALSEIYRYGTPENERELKVTRYALNETYHIYDPAWGTNYGTVKPAEGYQFLFVFLSVRHNGTGLETGAPFHGGFFVLSDGVYYSYKSDRTDSVTTIVDSFAARSEDYSSRETLRRWETREGFLVFEVPKTLSPEKTYITIDLGNDRVPAWKLA
jgi:hypothetical protein